MVNRRIRRAPRRQPRRRLKRVIRTTDVGINLRPPVDPPAFTPIPWWPLTVAFKYKIDKGKKVTSLKVSTLYTALKVQTGITNAFSVRILSIRVWGFNKKSLSLVIHDADGDVSRFRTITDVGSAVNYSRVGWRFGLEFTTKTHLPASDLVVADIYSASDSDGLVYVQILVCSNQSVDPPIAFLDNLKEKTVTDNFPDFEHLTMESG